MDIKAIKEDFNKLQTIVSDNNNKKIGLESEIRTLDTDLNEQIENVKKLTGQKSLEEAVKYYNESSTDLKTRAEKLQKELKDYLDKENGSDVVMPSDNGDFTNFDMN